MPPTAVPSTSATKKNAHSFQRPALTRWYRSVATRWSTSSSESESSPASPARRLRYSAGSRVFLRPPLPPGLLLLLLLPSACCWYRRSTSTAAGLVSADGVAAMYTLAAIQQLRALMLASIWSSMKYPKFANSTDCPFQIK
jgi:hypothetical protein